VSHSVQTDAEQERQRTWRRPGQIHLGHKASQLFTCFQFDEPHQPAAILDIGQEPVQASAASR
jgi:hypothetical protein